MERPGGDEQDVIGPHVAVAGLDGRALDDRQQVALHALPRHVRAAAFAGDDFVEFVQEDDAHVLGQFDGRVVDLLRVQQRVALLFEQHVASLGDGHFPVRRGLRQDLLEHALEVHIHLFQAQAADHDGGGFLLDRQLDAALVEFAGGQHGPHLGPAAFVLLRAALLLLFAPSNS